LPARCTASRSSNRCDFFWTKFLPGAKSKLFKQKKSEHAMSKYNIECEVAVKSLNALRKLPADSIAYDTQLVMLERHMSKIRALALAVKSTGHLEIQSFLDAPETRE
jgi:hypothetical protein